MKKILVAAAASLLLSSVAVAQGYYYGNAYGSNQLRPRGENTDQMIDRHRNFATNIINQNMIRNEMEMDHEAMHRRERLNEDRDYGRYSRY